MTRNPHRRHTCRKDFITLAKENIRDAVVAETSELTQIAFQAKTFWNYPNTYIEKWTEELTISSQYIQDNFVRCKTINDIIVGFYSLVYVPENRTSGTINIEKGIWLDHMFIAPKFHGNGIGRAFFVDIQSQLNRFTAEKILKIFVDPNAIGFYQKMGAQFIRNSDSSIPGRSIPIYSYDVQTNENYKN